MLKYEAFYKEHLRIISCSNKGEAQAFCPFHEDRQKASFSVNLLTGKWYCFAGCGGGTAKSFAERLGVKTTVPQDQDGALQQQEKLRKYIPAEEIKSAVKRLWSKVGKEAREYLRKRGIKDAIIKQFELGLEKDGSRIWIPVKDHIGYCNVRRYDYLKITDNKFLNYAEGYGELTLWPYGIVQQHDTVILCEGEPDTLLAHSLGFDNAICATGGAGSWNDQLTRMLAGKTVCICYDIDEPGRLGAQEVKRLLSASAKPIILQLPISEPTNADFSDYMRSVGFDPRVFIENVLGPATYEAPAKEVNLSSSTSLYQQKIRFQAVVNGKDMEPFLVPYKVTFTCRYSESSSACAQCPLKAFKSLGELEVPETSDVVLAAPESNDNMVIKNIIRHFGVPPRCPGVEFTVKETKPLWNVTLVNDLDSDEGREEGEYITRRAYSLVAVQPNVPYRFTAVAVKDPKTQSSLIEILDAEGCQTSLETFNLDKNKNLLKIWEV